MHVFYKDLKSLIDCKEGFLFTIMILGYIQLVFIHGLNYKSR